MAVDDLVAYARTLPTRFARPTPRPGSFLLPVKAAIRDKQNIDDGDLVVVTITTQ